MNIRDSLKDKEIIFTDEFNARSVSRGVYEIFMDRTKLRAFVEDSIRSNGAIIDDSEHGENSFKCIDILNDKFITIPFATTKFIFIKTIFWSQQLDINKYKLEKQKIKGEADVR